MLGREHLRTRRTLLLVALLVVGAVAVASARPPHDQWGFIFLHDGTTIHDGPGNLNFSYFNDPVFNERMHAAAELIGDERYDAFQDIEHDLRARRSSVGGHADLQRRLRLETHRLPASRGAAEQRPDLVYLCLRPEITTDDAVTPEPVSGTTVVHVPVRLSS